MKFMLLSLTDDMRMPNKCEYRIQRRVHGTSLQSCLYTPSFAIFILEHVRTRVFIVSEILTIAMLRQKNMFISTLR